MGVDNKEGEESRPFSADSSCAEIALWEGERRRSELPFWTFNLAFALPSQIATSRDL